MNISNRPSTFVVAIAGLCWAGLLLAASDNDTEIAQGASASEEAPSPSAGEETFDILGLTLGMTPEEVASIMESINAEPLIDKRERVSGTDIEFLARQQWMRRLDNHSEDFVVEYARPPSGPLVMNLVRNFRGAHNLSLSGRDCRRSR